MVRPCSLRARLKTRLHPEHPQVSVNKQTTRVFCYYTEYGSAVQSVLILLDYAVPVQGTAAVWDIWSITPHIG
jgi:hypothetical protein